MDAWKKCRNCAFSDGTSYGSHSCVFMLKTHDNLPPWIERRPQIIEKIGFKDCQSFEPIEQIRSEVNDFQFAVKALRQRGFDLDDLTQFIKTITKHY